ncbi:hypothetical protein FRX31_026400 [Thalictrum thalictroides]|uniref:Uncharacterized protein n=1 Tax=Thalictrum thalictroides TaxID=46969 RepID=A0A7J6VFX9_THATH|nr:hypothetical protein FRX31_026400 [Thalictrum thalictroides]
MYGRPSLGSALLALNAKRSPSAGLIVLPMWQQSDQSFKTRARVVQLNQYLLTEKNDKQKLSC